MLMFGLRLGDDPRAVVTTTPKPIKIIRELIADPTTVITRGSTYDNRANLAPAFLQQIVRKYEGTRLGRQELNAEILDDVPADGGALLDENNIMAPPWQLSHAQDRGGPCRQDGKVGGRVKSLATGVAAAVLAARKLGIDPVPCIELAGLSAAQRRAYILRRQ
jgi:hypothetical protein